MCGLWRHTRPRALHKRRLCHLWIKTSNKQTPHSSAGVRGKDLNLKFMCSECQPLCVCKFDEAGEILWAIFRKPPAEAEFVPLSVQMAHYFNWIYPHANELTIPHIFSPLSTSKICARNKLISFSLCSIQLICICIYSISRSEYTAWQYSSVALRSVTTWPVGASDRRGQKWFRWFVAKDCARVDISVANFCSRCYTADSLVSRRGYLRLTILQCRCAKSTAIQCRPY